jgi:general stress protein 26
MSETGLGDIAKKLKSIDFCMMSTHGGTGAITNRPMSNNGDVEYDGSSWFFSYTATNKVAEISRNAQLTLSFSEPSSLLGKPGMFISIEGEASLIRDQARFEEHWVPDLDRWFPQGTKTPGILLIKVQGKRVQYWDGEENGTFLL